MKTKITLLWILLVAILANIFVCTGVIAGESDPKQKSQEFKVSVTIIYNSITLEQAAKIEKDMRLKYKDSCSVTLDVDTTPPSNIFMFYYTGAQ